MNDDDPKASARDTIAPLIGKGGKPFSDADLDDASSQLERLSTEDRWEFLRANARAIAQHPDERILIVAGAGTGKSALFMDRIRYWLETHPGRRIFVSSFVRKLVADLESDVRSSNFESDQKELVTVKTLHHLARSILERNRGTHALPLGSYVKMISQEWKETVWDDAVSLLPRVGNAPRFEFMESQFHKGKYSQEDDWPRLRQSYFTLCRFYNAVGFPDSILHATEAIRERPDLNEHTLWIFDEFQDFNTAEDELIRACAESADGILLTGDDDQALYQTLKSSLPEIIRSYYTEEGYTKAMLPFCTRCSYHICMGAAAFLRQRREPGSVRKIYLPSGMDADAARIKFVACAHPTSAVAYIRDFIESNRALLVERRDSIQRGDPNDPFLLILTPQTDIGFYQQFAEPLQEMVREWRVPSAEPGEDYRRLYVYFRHAQVPADNFACRKVLYFEGVADSTVREILKKAIESERALVKVTHDAVISAHAKCLEVAQIVEDEALDAHRKVDALASLIDVRDHALLASDLDSRPPGRFMTRRAEDEEEEVETTGRVSPVELITMHKAKGLTADHVVLLGFDQVNMTNSSWQLFFVAMTRARHSLHLITALRAGGANQPHRFMNDIPEVHSTHVKFTKEGETVFESRGRFLGFLDWLSTSASGKADQ